MITIAAVVLAVVALALVLRSVVVVPNGFAYVLERLGRVDRVLRAGLHVAPPFLTRVSARIPLGQQTLDLPAAPCTTRDGAAATCGGSVVFRVVDPGLAVSAVADFRSALAQLISRAWADAVGASTLLDSVDAVRAAHREAQPTAARWGIEIVEAHPLLRPSDQAMRQLETLAAGERDAKVTAWLKDRNKVPGPDGRPTPEQFAAYREWLDLEVRIHQREIEAARKAFEGS